MEFQPDPAIESFRQEVRDFLKENLPPDLARRGQQGYLPDRDDQLRWTRILHETRGWSVVGWPTEYGGPGWSAEQRYVFDEECYLAGAPLQNQSGVHLAGPVICKFGSEEQKRRFLPGMREGKVFWVQGFSEPGAGSDLVSLRTTAVRDGDHYIVNGQKIWTSYGIHGDWNFVLVRTDPDARPQRGISFLLLDIRSPGVTVRPITTLEGSHHLAEVFYDNVRVPAENLVGAENEGWTYTKSLLFDERAFQGAEAPALKRYLARIRRYATIQRDAGRPLIEDPAFVQRLAQFELEVLALDMTVKRVLHQGLDERNGGMAIASMLKVRGSEMHQKLTEMLVEIIGDYGAVYYPDSNDDPSLREQRFPGPDFAPGIVAELIYRRACTIYGGSAEIQRNIIAKALFNL
ncbi:MULTISPECIES: acyl-CoA dehydrogenase family protein [unclassified Caballeronia]|uniref:acyl-CoA dehydrogenase family protein n=1 Tax=unclassified Caballeronia TaxID=2646786 RepID=UPI002854BB0D|nr:MULTISPECIES: acyl-CoA dehydrogenase family protein [unclassified Caballeronia]MDR5777317.1 acyl-CoA dehydrogenase family protein [Caballeronia sp. LZ002]MDR5852751.1 acyl-CoA dehydrogenase family protein [Caballeronia sp. LZ003]